ncbi:hypothetical protein [Idiomarina loihiensis]|uniref:hypothetical protein n=1 Tax=Idiomarina loihiensis TaxID=135577 RepID=UPI0038512014
MTLQKYLEESISSLLHKLCFEDDFAPVFDSMFDEYEQPSSATPGTVSYIEKINRRRRRLGVTPTEKNGALPDDSSQKLTQEWTSHLLSAHRPEFERSLSLALFYQNPAGTDCIPNDNDTEYDLVATEIMRTKRKGLKQSLEQSLKGIFGNNVCKNIDFDELTNDVINSMTLRFVQTFSAPTGNAFNVKCLIKDIEHIQQQKQLLKVHTPQILHKYDNLHAELDKRGYVGIRPCRKLY